MASEELSESCQCAQACLQLDSKTDTPSTEAVEDEDEPLR